MHIGHWPVEILNIQRLLGGRALRLEISDKVLHLFPEKEQEERSNYQAHPYYWVSQVMMVQSSPSSIFHQHSKGLWFFILNPWGQFFFFLI
jgi:hypothetical protein